MLLRKFFYLLLLFSIFSYAQQKGSLSGKVIDKTTGKPLVNAPDTGSNAADGWGSRRSGHPWDGAKAARRPRTRARGRWPAGRWRYGRYRRPLPCRRAAAGRSPVYPSIPAGAG